jgi:hypothetical protein
MNGALIERRMILQLLAGEVTPDNLAGSTSRIITAFLAVGRFESLPEPYGEKEDAWARLSVTSCESSTRPFAIRTGTRRSTMAEQDDIDAN